MLDINFIRENKDVVKTALQNRGKDVSLLDKVLEIDQARRNIQFQVDEKRAAQNKISRDIKGKPSEDQIKAAAEIKAVLKELEAQQRFTDEELNKVLEELPNIPASFVPIGKDDSENEVIKTVGKPPEFDFTPLDHIDLGVKCDILDVETAAKVSGSRFGYYKNEGAVLEFALMWYGFNKIRSHGFSPMIPPYMVKSDSEWKMGYTSNSNLHNAYYHLEEDDLVFVSSSEHSIGPYYMDTTLNLKELPLQFVSFSPCFRREAGTYGKDMRGMLRMHCFNKVEMVCITEPDYAKSDAQTQKMLEIEQEILTELGLSFQVMRCCTGDLPHPNRSLFDINTYFPGQGRYRETSSCSNCGDYQTRRLKTQVKIGGKSIPVHMQNATGIVDRVVLAIIENYQQKDGSIVVPKVLQSLTGFEIIKPKHD